MATYSQLQVFKILMILQAKIQRLEHLVHLKDLRLDELQARIDAARPTGNKR